jgi:protein O-mannosyl-transferase
MAKGRPPRRGGSSSVVCAPSEDRRLAQKPPAGASRLRDLSAWAALFCAALLVYGPALHGSLLWDDAAHVTQPDLQSLHGLWRIWFDLGATQQYYPVLHSAFWVEHRLWGDAVLDYHLVNLILHLLSAWLVVSIVRKLALPGAWLAGCVWVLHPVYVESVAWISEQKSTLSGAFCLASLLLYLHFDQSRRRRTWLLAGGLFILAILSKSVTATLPAALLVILWWKRGRLEWKRDVLPLVPWFALAVPMGIFTAWVERTYVGASGSDFAMSFIQRILLAGRVIWFYAAELIWPANLIFQYPRWTLDPAAWWQYLFPAGVLLALAGLAVAARRNRGPLASFLVFGGTLFPVLGFLNVLPFRYSWVADHFQYLPSLAIVIPLASWLTLAASRYSTGRAGLIAAVPLLAVLGLLSWRQAGFYRDDETLYRETLARNPSSWLAHNNLGSVLESKPGRLKDAIAEYQASLELAPGYPQPHLNLASALSKLQDPSQVPAAIAEFQESLRLKPDYAEAHTDLANLLSSIPGRMPEAVDHYRMAAQLLPQGAPAHANLGGALAQLGRLPEAIAEFETALRLDPGLAELHCNLGVALAQVGRLPEAVAEFDAALRINPNMAEAHFLLGTALAQIPGRTSDAVAECQAALRINSDLEPARQLLQQLLAEQPSGGAR